jgi:hypothetical protein
MRIDTTKAETILNSLSKVGQPATTAVHNGTSVGVNA